MLERARWPEGPNPTRVDRTEGGPRCLVNRLLTRTHRPRGSLVAARVVFARFARSVARRLDGGTRRLAFTTTMPTRGRALERAPGATDEPARRGAQRGNVSHQDDRRQIRRVVSPLASSRWARRRKDRPREAAHRRPRASHAPPRTAARFAGRIARRAAAHHRRRRPPRPYAPTRRRADAHPAGSHTDGISLRRSQTRVMWRSKSVASYHSKERPSRQNPRRTAQNSFRALRGGARRGGQRRQRRRAPGPERGRAQGDSDRW